MSEERIEEEKEKKLEDIRKEAEGKACAVQRALHFITEFLEGPMCGKCYPCALGTYEAKVKLTKISRHLGDVSDADVSVLLRIGRNMIEGSFCKKGKDTGRFLTETLTGAEDEFKQHISGQCPKQECVTLIKYVINPERCTMCGNCADACKYGAILGEKRTPYRSGYLPFEIRQKRCTKCGKCVTVCTENAIEVISEKVAELINT